MNTRQPKPSALTGFRYLLGGLKLIRQPGLRRYVLIPATTNVLIFGSALYFLAGWFGGLMASLTAWLPDWLDWLSYILWLVFAVGILIGVFYTFTLFANLIAAPFNGMLAAQVEARLTGGPPPDSGHSLMVEASKAVKSELTKIVWLLPRLIGLAVLTLILTFIPPLNTLVPFIWFAWGAWMLSLTYLDYPCGNHRQYFADTRDMASKKRSLCLGFGAAATLGTMIPLVNFFVMPTAVAGATAMYVDHFKRTSPNNDTWV